MTNLEQIQEFVDAQNATNSNTDKLNVLKKYANNEAVRNALEYTYNTFKQYGVTSANCKKNSNLIKYGYTDLFKLLDDLSIRFITGHTAISLVNGFVEANKKHEELIFSIIDRNLKTRSTTSMINKVILLGRLGKDPVIRKLDNGRIVANVSLATNDFYTKDGQRMESTEWHNLEMWDQQALTAEKYFKFTEVPVLRSDGSYEQVWQQTTST